MILGDFLILNINISSIYGYIYKKYIQKKKYINIITKYTILNKLNDEMKWQDHFFIYLIIYR